MNAVLRRRSLAILLLLWAGACLADVRLRNVLYDADEVYWLPAYAGYETDIQFEADERFVGLGAGDLKGLSFSAQRNHLFIKPSAADVNTDITVLTDRRVYHFDYVAVAHAPDASHADVLYALRFLYPAAPPVPAPAPPSPPAPSQALEALLGSAARQRPRNEDYWFCGPSGLQPLAAWDDGVQTHLRFSSRQDMPALFLKNDDGSESLLNFHIDQDEVVVHRVVQRLILRRGALVGCVVNRAYAQESHLGSGATLSPRVHRDLQGGDHD
ncbi:MAG TPA: TrbG/VirB9 family P-type conjugative transfer protein [Steroidobacteraceae bacterium]|nr:TrbG/VirB9 family P-type conjugative transfer protein [Steroidobacteraceae bacterium]